MVAIYLWKQYTNRYVYIWKAIVFLSRQKWNTMFGMIQTCHTDFNLLWIETVRSRYVSVTFLPIAHEIHTEFADYDDIGPCFVNSTSDRSFAFEVLVTWAISCCIFFRDISVVYSTFSCSVTSITCRLMLPKYFLRRSYAFLQNYDF